MLKLILGILTKILLNMNRCILQKKMGLALRWGRLGCCLQPWHPTWLPHSLSSSLLTPVKAAENDLGMWLSAPHVGDPDEAPEFCLAWPQMLWSLGGMNQKIAPLCLFCLSLCNSSKETHFRKRWFKRMSG